MSSDIQLHITQKWKGKSQVMMFPLVRELIFSIGSSLFFDMNDGSERRRLHQLMETTIVGSISIPLDFPGTAFVKALEAHSIIEQILSSLMKKRRIE
ncbi:hypothetical protein SUGI_0904200 [Cryptomeria japonica]|nr:hypothetical protein SUGI_0904200 [Cryptomeria japonica]